MDRGRGGMGLEVTEGLFQSSLGLLLCHGWGVLCVMSLGTTKGMTTRNDKK